MYLNRRMWNDPLALKLGPIEQKVAQRLEENPGAILKKAEFGSNLTACIKRLRKKGFQITTICGQGWIWDGVSK